MFNHAGPALGEAKKRSDSGVEAEGFPLRFFLVGKTSEHKGMKEPIKYKSVPCYRERPDDALIRS